MTNHRTPTRSARPDASGSPVPEAEPSAVEALPGGGRPRGSRPGAVLALAVLTVALVAASLAHLLQGTSGVGLAEFAGLLTGSGSSAADAARDILTGSRLPRLAAGLAVGSSLGVAGALLQSITRNPLAAPDTLAVTAGSFFAVTAVAAFGLAVPLWASGAVAVAGGLAAAGLVLLVGGGGGTSTTRLVLAGSAVALALQSGTSALLVLFQQETTGLFSWGSGSLSQLGIDAFARALPVVAVATAGALLLSRRLDLLGIGDDSARMLGVPVRRTRVLGVVLAVVLTATSVTLAGPIGFVGLCAPVIARLLARVAPSLLRHVVLLPAAGLLGALIVLVADIVVRLVLGAEQAIAIPTGVVTTIAGAVVLVALARRTRDAGPTREPPAAPARPRSRGRFRVVLAVALVAVASVVLLGLLAGSRWLLTGDILLWLQGQAPPLIAAALDERAPRVLAAVLAGGAIALAGCLVQSTTRNPLAEPGLIGITGGAGLAAVVVVTLAGAVGGGAMLLAAVAGGLAAFAVVYALTWRGGLHADRLVLVGIGTWYGTTALTTFLLIRSDPWNTPRIYTWLSGSTYGRGWDQVLPVAVALVVVALLAGVLNRELDLLALDEDTPRLVGVPLERVRLLVLAAAAVLAALSVVAVGVVAFVGLVAPHAARALVGARSARSIPVAVALGALLLGLADAIGRTVVAPAQVPAGIVVALIGTPYFIYLLARSRAS
ncbi:iron ABC transporter permease [Herbiconiux sp. SYSU D00978]|uniref:iron ABC transporter permease n=1 Tax=Herbiconiux sp. SYSU D00978 TaxID=2812562 RepID=UPI0027DC3906|nr:iron ABC transporter permease [Herbiconiux sp. SYSU D00978]